MCVWRGGIISTALGWRSGRVLYTMCLEVIPRRYRDYYLPLLRLAVRTGGSSSFTAA